MLRKYGVALLDAMFQSAPGLEAGRCANGDTVTFDLVPRFNPRPALRPGDAGR